MRCFDVTYVYPKNHCVTFLDVHARLFREARAVIRSDMREVLNELGNPKRIVVKKHAYYHGWFDELTND